MPAKSRREEPAERDSESQRDTFNRIYRFWGQRTRRAPDPRLVSMLSQSVNYFMPMIYVAIVCSVYAVGQIGIRLCDRTAAPHASREGGPAVQMNRCCDRFRLFVCRQGRCSGFAIFTVSCHCRLWVCVCASAVANKRNRTNNTTYLERISILAYAKCLVSVTM